MLACLPAEGRLFCLPGLPLCPELTYSVAAAASSFAKVRTRLSRLLSLTKAHPLSRNLLDFLHWFWDCWGTQSQGVSNSQVLCLSSVRQALCGHSDHWGTQPQGPSSLKVLNLSATAVGSPAQSDLTNSMYVCMNVCMYVHACVCICMHVCVWMYCVYIHVYVYVYMYIPSYLFCFSRNPWLIRIPSILPQVNLHPCRVTLYSYVTTLPLWNSLDLRIHYCIIFSWAPQNSQQEWPQWAYAICGSFLTTRNAEAIHTNLQLRTQRLFGSTIEP